MLYMALFRDKVARTHSEADWRRDMNYLRSEKSIAAVCHELQPPTRPKEVTKQVPPHIASLPAVPAGVTREHLEAKHLGRLFDQYRAQQALLKEEVSPPDPLVWDEDVPRGNDMGLKSNLRCDVTVVSSAEELTVNREASEHKDDLGSVDANGTKSKERRLGENIFQLSTNPKYVWGTSEWGTDTCARQPPKYIEDFPTVKLATLVNGRWRFNM